MNLSPFGKILLGSILVAFGIIVLTDFSPVKAFLYFGAALLSIIFFR